MRTLVFFTALVLSACNCGGGGTPTDAGPTLLTCTGILQCVNACSAADAGACATDCIDRGSQAARGELSALLSCDQANTCNGNDTCLSTNCAAQVAGCVGGGTGGGSGAGGGGGGFDGGSGGSGDGFPARFTGTVGDETPNFGGTRLQSTGNVVFVRDDSADPRGTSGMFAFYKLQSVTYVATQTGTDFAGCTLSANETVTVMNPPPFENLVSIMKQPNGQGRYAYDVSTSLSTNRPNSLSFNCPPPAGTSVANWNAELNVAAGVPEPTTADRYKLTATVPMGGRTWSWDLTGSD